MDFFTYLKDELHIELNDQQKEAVKALDRRILLEACPGSGKTTTLVSRVAYLIFCGKASPSDMLTLTFSRASAMDMESRFQSLFGSIIEKPVSFSTIHSFCYRFLQYCQKRGILVIPQLLEKQENGGKIKILKNIYFHVYGEYPGEEEAEGLSNEISLVRNKLIDPEEFTSSFREFSVIYHQYEEYKKRKNLIDFDDMLVITYRILINNREIYRAYGRFIYVHVDEVQDTSFLQHKIIEILSQDENLFMVGDTDQSIYGFRGAEPEYIVNIKKQFPEIKIMRLETNYRSTGHIVGLANRFVRQNIYRHPKEMRTNNNEGEMPKSFYAKNEKEQWMQVIRLIERDETHPLTAVLFRNNLSGIPLAFELIRKGIPFYIRENNSNFFRSYVVFDVFSFFMLSSDPYDLASFTKIYYKLAAPISKSDIQVLNERMNGKKDIFTLLTDLYWKKKYMMDHLSRIQKAFAKIKHATPYKAIYIMEKELGYGTYLKRSSEGKEIFSILKYLAEGTKTTDEFKMRLRTLKNGMNQCYRQKDIARTFLLTLHGSKGLEFDRIIMMDLIDGQFPSEKVIDDMIRGDRRTYEEEVRLFYVGVTRAKCEVIFIAPQKKEGKSVIPSRFIEHFMKGNHLQEIKASQTVYHKRFGEGVVIGGNDDVIEVMFKKFGKRKLAVQICLESGLIQMDGNGFEKQSKHDE